METVVLIVGAGPSGLAVAACLNLAGVPNLVLERDDSLVPLWRKRSYDRLQLHLPKELCQLPHLPHPPSAPQFIPKDEFIRYLDGYASHFSIHPLYHREVVSASYNAETSRWHLSARKGDSEELEDYTSQFLVVASGENDALFVPNIPGMDTFPGDVVHSSHYRNAEPYAHKRVMVVGAGNSGMEIACDLCEHGARSVSIVVRSPIHIVSKEIWKFGIWLSKLLSIKWVDVIVLLLCHLKFGDMSRYGVRRPKEGPYYLKAFTPVYPVVDVGTAAKIKSGEIQVLGSIKYVEKDKIILANGKEYCFDAIVLATGYRSMVRKWLKDGEDLIGEDGLAKNKFPNHWKGRNGLYCAGLVRRGLYGSCEDAESIALDIVNNLNLKQTI